MKTPKYSLKLEIIKIYEIPMTEKRSVAIFWSMVENIILFCTKSFEFCTIFV